MGSSANLAGRRMTQGQPPRPHAASKKSQCEPLGETLSSAHLLGTRALAKRVACLCRVAGSGATAEARRRIAILATTTVADLPGRALLLEHQGSGETQRTGTRRSLRAGRWRRHHFVQKTCILTKSRVYRTGLQQLTTGARRTFRLQRLSRHLTHRCNPAKRCPLNATPLNATPLNATPLNATCPVRLSLRILRHLIINNKIVSQWQTRKIQPSRHS